VRVVVVTMAGMASVLAECRRRHNGRGNVSYAVCRRAPVEGGWCRWAREGFGGCAQNASLKPHQCRGCAWALRCW
jgi:hypothetical protein